MTTARQIFVGAVLAALVACLAGPRVENRLGAPIGPNQNSQTLFLYQQIYDGGPGSYGDGGPSSYADGGPYTSSDAGYFCDGGQFFNPSSDCYQLTYDGGPLSLDAGPVTYDAGPYAYDAGVGLPFAILDAGVISLPIWLPQYEHLSWVGKVTTDGGQSATGTLALFVTNDGLTYTKLSTPTPIALAQDGGSGQSSITYSLDLGPMDFLGAELVFTETSGSNGVIIGSWYVKP